MQEPSFFFFFILSPAFLVCRVFDDGHSDWCNVVSHCSFDFHFSNNEWCSASFPVLVSHLYVFFEEMLCRSSVYFLIGLFFCFQVVWAVCIFWKLSPSQLHHFWIFSPNPCCCLVAQSCLTLCDPMDCSRPGSSVYGIIPARILEGVAISSSRGSSWLRDHTCVSCIGRRNLYH